MQLIRLPQVMAATGLKRSSLYALVSANQFPKPLKIGLRSVAWPASDINAWIESRIAARDSKGGPA